MKTNLYRAYVDRPGNGWEGFFKAKSVAGVRRQFKKLYREPPDAVDLLPDNYYEVMANDRRRDCLIKLGAAAKEYTNTVRKIMEEYESIKY